MLRLDPGSAALLIVGLLCGFWSYLLITTEGFNPLIIVPSVAVATVGTTNLFQRQAPH